MEFQFEDLSADESLSFKTLKGEKRLLVTQKWEIENTDLSSLLYLYGIFGLLWFQCKDQST